MMLAKLILVALVTVGAMQSAPAPSNDTPTSLPSADPKILMKAQEWFYRFQTGKIDRSQLDVRTNNGLTQQMVAGEEKTLQALGRPSKWLYFGSQPVQYAVGYEFGIQFKHARVLEHIAFDADGKIAGLQFQVYPY
ncbi:MAG TPA: hypothetical protein VFO29_03935 [Candidatus Rubrimentiphilum sp.]|nr:hypothetical protein [Candidatus Rubrimentiphilum sp.]